MVLFPQIRELGGEICFDTTMPQIYTDILDTQQILMQQDYYQAKYLRISLFFKSLLKLK